MLPLLRAREYLADSLVIAVGAGEWKPGRKRQVIADWERRAKRRGDQVALTDLPPALAEQRLAGWGIAIEWVTTAELEAQAAQQLEVREEAD